MDPVYFVPITKVDVEKREVWGRAVQEVPDKSKEIFDYATSAPLFRSWSEGFDKATDGKSLGNIRAMHGKVAAGKVTAIDFNDADKAIDICAKVVDDAEWNKVQEGVYTGFSIGGSYEKRWTDGDLKRYTAKPAEISLVDNPCVPTARFQMIKADGQVEEKEFKAPDPAASKSPIDVEALKQLGKTEEPKPVADATGEPAKAAPAEVKKSLYSVQMLASLMSAIAGMVSDATFEAAIEGDESPVPAQLRSWLASGLQILNAMTAEESAELLASLTEKVEGAELDLVKFLSKAGARHSASDQKNVQGVHDAAVALGAGCGAGEKAAGSEDLTKMTGDLTKLTTENDELKKRVAELEKQPETPKGVQKVVDKGDDVVDTTKKEEIEDKSPIGLMKAAQAKPHFIKL